MPTIRAAVRHLALWATIAAIATVFSERVFWFWTTSPVSHIELSLFYALPVGVVMVAIGRFRVDLGWSLLLVAPIFAFIVEGVLTPIIYTGPFLPVFPAWFTAWHGIMALVVAVFLVRSWLLTDRRGLLALVSIGLGCFWGIWASTLRLPENVQDVELLADHDELVVLGPAAFARYAVTFTAIFVVAHLVLGFVWPTASGPWRSAERVVGALVAVGVIGWSVAVPWALPMFALYLLVPWLALRWHGASHRANRAHASPDLISQLQGRVGFGAAAPLVLLAPAAASTYAALWAVDPSEDALRALMYSTIAVQSVAAAALVIVAVRRIRRNRPGPEGRSDEATGSLSWRRPGRGRPGTPAGPGAPDRADEDPRHARTLRWVGGLRSGARSMPAR